MLIAANKLYPASMFCSRAETLHFPIELTIIFVCISLLLYGGGRVVGATMLHYGMIERENMIYYRKNCLKVISIEYMHKKCVRSGLMTFELCEYTD